MQPSVPLLETHVAEHDVQGVSVVMQLLEIGDLEKGCVVSSSTQACRLRYDCVVFPKRALKKTPSGISRDRALATWMFGRTSGVTAGGHTPLHTSSTTSRKAANGEIKGCILWRWSDGDDHMWVAAETIADAAAYLCALAASVVVVVIHRHDASRRVGNVLVYGLVS